MVRMGYKTYTCPIAKRCGGCEWLAVPYPIQLRRKQEQVVELLGEMAAADGTQIDAVLGMDEPLAYRHKAATPFAPGSRGRVRAGFYERGTHRIVACPSCLAEDPRARAILNAVARTAERLRIPAYDEDRGSGILRHAVVRCGYATKDILLTVVTNGERLPRAKEFVRELRQACPEITSIVQNVNDRRTNAILGFRTHTLFGPGTMRDRLLGCDFEIGPTAFYQTNPAQTERLYQLAIEGAALADGETLLDAYCGCGTIGICAASAARDAGATVQVVGIEQVRGAVKAARRNAQANGLADRCSLVQGDATAWLAGHAAPAAHGTLGSHRQGLQPRTAESTTPGTFPDAQASGGHVGERGTNGPASNRMPASPATSSGHADMDFDVAVLDPPRAGSTPEFLAALAARRPSRIVYVSCNVVTQARDLALLRERGYRLARVAPVDMFPHTKHVETVVLLTRAQESGPPALP